MRWHASSGSLIVALGLLFLGGCVSTNQHRSICPSCNTPNYIDYNVLRQYEGRIRCYRCQNVYQVPGFQSGSTSQYAGNSAEAEYQAAFQEYNQALQDLQTARSADTLNTLNRGSLLGEGLTVRCRSPFSRLFMRRSVRRVGSFDHRHTPRDVGTERARRAPALARHPKHAHHTPGGRPPSPSASQTRSACA